AGSIDQRRALRQHGKRPRIQYPFRLGGQRQQADEDLASSEQGRQTDGGRITLQPLDSFWTASPQSDIETQPLELASGILSQLAEAENADAALGRVLLVELEPNPAFLAGAIIEVLAMQPQHLKDDVLAHRIRHVWIDETDDRYAARQVWVDEDMVDPGAEGEDQLQVRQGRQQSGL